MHVGDLLFYLSVAATLVFAALAVGGHTRQLVDRAEEHPLGEQLTITCAVGATVIATIHAFMHLRHFATRKQRLVIRILFLVPVYAIDSLLAYEEPNEASVFAIARDTYEAIALDSFFRLLLEQALAVDILRWWKSQEEYKNLGQHSIDKWRRHVMLYTVSSPLLTIITFAAMRAGWYDEASWSALNLHVYVAIARGVACTLSLNAVLAFYQATKHHHVIHAAGPTAQFISLKAVIFCVCWQGLVLTMLAKYNLLPVESIAKFLLPESSWRTKSGEELTEATLAAMESAMICVEMLAAACAHFNVFNYKIFGAAPSETNKKAAKNTSPQSETEPVLVHTSITHTFINVVNFSDLVDEVKAVSSPLAPPPKQQQQQQQQPKKDKSAGKKKEDGAAAAAAATQQQQQKKNTQQQQQPAKGAAQPTTAAQAKQTKPLNQPAAKAAPTGGKSQGKGGKKKK